MVNGPGGGGGVVNAGVVGGVVNGAVGCVVNGAVGK